MKERKRKGKTGVSLLPVSLRDSSRIPGVLCSPFYIKIPKRPFINRRLASSQRLHFSFQIKERGFLGKHSFSQKSHANRLPDYPEALRTLESHWSIFFLFKRLVNGEKCEWRVIDIGRRD
ncbi:hypothetical protein TNIN_329441 [Trichonephila inaurata madagascariensis]|uniref:Uncharacterized protein n=1 Tax=Trichonephila inaurata madagascariensis TaxID=2747483 RepID=A0A8X6Y5N8_9ARAC|nr:hypothetical protein TNIN_329441 [Trichonephila inaurata madagascariensis]